MNYAIAGSFSIMMLAFSFVVNADGGIIFALGFLLGVLAPWFIDLFVH